jgi:hypothetical protein
MCEQVKITWSQVQTVGRMGKDIPGKVPAQVLCTNSPYLLDYPYIIQYIQIFTFVDNRWEDKRFWTER